MIPTERNLAESLRRSPDPAQIVRGGDDRIARRSDDQADIASDFRRLETSIQWLKHERMIAALEAGLHAQHHKRRLACANVPLSRQASVARPPEDGGACSMPAAPSVEVASAIAEHLSSPVQKRKYFYGLSLLWAATILFGSVVAVLVAYYAFSEGWRPALLAMQARLGV